MFKRHLLLISAYLIAFIGYAQSGKFQYTGKNLQSLSVPIGGISTGNILLGGRGNIEHIEVFNRPDRVREPVNTFFAIHVSQEGEESINKVLEREYYPPYTGESHTKASGLPRLKEATFTNRFPLAKWQFQDAGLPLNIGLEVFTPFVPLNVSTSSFPVIRYTWKLKNTSSKKVSAAIMLTMENPIKAEKISNTYYQTGSLEGTRFQVEEGPETVNYQGDFLVMTSAPNTTIQTHLYPGRWRDDLTILWKDFSDDGKIAVDHKTWESTYKKLEYNEISNRNTAISVSIELNAGEEIEVPFYMAWYFPNRIFTANETLGINQAVKVFGNYYKSLFTSATDALETFVNQQTELYQLTKTFSEALNEGSYESEIIEALSTQATSIRTNLIQMTEKGEVHGFEGVTSEGWCCPGTCTHVWNYEQTLASLFPSMERNMREIEFLKNVDELGRQDHRAVFPLGDYGLGGSLAADGQMGSIIRLYREWKMLGDNQWLSKMWPKVKLALEYAWHSDWDRNQDGIMEGQQPNTYDISFYGPSSMTTSCYLGALKAGSEMALAMGESKKAKQYAAVYDSGVKKMEDILWNGEYFIQVMPEIQTEKLPDKVEMSPPDQNGKVIPKYQYGDGCLADQLLGQYIAHNAGLGFLVDEEKTRLALRAVYENNYIPRIGDYGNVQRIYALNEDGGVVLCSWPHDNEPLLPFVYAQEVWTGVEFAVAASMIHAGMVEEGKEIVQAVQRRYDGFRRNPFMHDESGVHYARAMSSWSVLLALTGFQYDGTTKTMAFGPKGHEGDFSTFWSTGNAWGTFKIAEGNAWLEVLYGTLELNSFELSYEDKVNKGEGYRLKVDENRSTIHFTALKRIGKGERLILRLE